MKDLQCRSFQFSTHLDGISVDEVWARVGSWSGVNAELGPWFRMTFPAKFPRVDDIPADGNHHFTSTVLLLGFLPIDRHRFRLMAMDPPKFFDEKSSNFTMTVWTHKRTLVATDTGVQVTDQCGFVPRFEWMGGLLLHIYKGVFQRRHRLLRQHFAN